MSPMTVDYLARLSRGKPNQIRLIGNSIYKRYQRGEQEDLNIKIETMEDVVDNIESAYSAEYDLRKQVETIRKLNSVDLESLYNMTRFPNWSIEDVIDLDESFRGESQSQLASQRRRLTLEKKRQKFLSIGLMESDPHKFVLSGGEFVHLYLRFWYEIRKFGDLSRRLELGKGPPTPFSEKTEKLIHSLSWELSRTPDIVYLGLNRSEVGASDIIGGVKRRFSSLEKLLSGESSAIKDVDKGAVAECLNLCELVTKPGPHHLLILCVRNLENPRELHEVEMYFTGEELLVVPLDAISLIKRQADDSRVWLEEFEHFPVNLPNLSGLLEALGVPTLDELVSQLNPVARWRFSSVQHLLRAKQLSSSERVPQNGEEANVEDEHKWVDLYRNGAPSKAEEYLTSRLLEPPEGPKSARLYNDRGYIRYGLNQVELAVRDLQRALDLHFAHLSLTLLNLSVIDIDREQYESAINRIDEALFLTFGRQDIDASFLRLRLLKSHLFFGAQERWEQRPANVLEAAYINLAYASLRLHGSDAAMDAFQEALELIPSSIRLKHALARFHLSRNHAPLADPFYRELAQSKLTDERLAREVNSYVKRALPKPRRPRSR